MGLLQGLSKESFDHCTGTPRECRGRQLFVLDTERAPSNYTPRMANYRTPDEFRAQRSEAQTRLEACDHLGIKRFLALDSGAYRDHAQEGGLPAPTLELLGLVASTVLRCDDCITYHLEQCAKAGWTVKQIEDALNVAMVVGGSITIPHVRRGLLLLDQFAREHPSR